jgi:hypothetical protein
MTKLVDQLTARLAHYVGETGESEGAVDVLERLLREVEAARSPERVLANAAPDYTKSVLTEEAGDRKAVPIFSGCLNYFPLAIAAVAEVSKAGNDQHNPGEPLHWARGKSMDHADCIIRHQLDYRTVDPVTGKHEHARRVAWRALAQLQELEEERLGAEPCRGSFVERH